MVLTKDELISSLQNEVRILLHLAGKVDRNKVDYRPGAKQRSATQLRTPSRCAPARSIYFRAWPRVASESSIPRTAFALVRSCGDLANAGSRAECTGRKTVKAIVSSGYATEDQAEHYRKLGFAGMLSKPYRSGDLGRALKDLVEKEYGEREERHDHDEHRQQEPTA